LLHHVLPHCLWPYKQGKQRKGILKWPTWTSIPPPYDRQLQLFTQKVVNDVSCNWAVSKFEEWKVRRVILSNIPQFLHPTSYNNISKDASIIHYESKGRYGIYYQHFKLHPLQTDPPISLLTCYKTLALKNSNATYVNFFPLYFHFFIVLVLLLKFEEYTSI
jgi:hypothetical protein